MEILMHRESQINLFVKSDNKMQRILTELMFERASVSN